MNINFLAILVLAAFSMVLGSLWYGPLFGKQWIKLMKFSKAEIEEGKKKGMAGMWKNYLFTFIGSFVMVYVLSMFVKFVGASTLIDGAIVGFWVWIGFYVTKSMGSVFWEGKPFNLFLLNNFHDMVFIVISGAVLAVWP